MQITRYVINLESRTDRRHAMERELRSVGWSAHFSVSKKPDDPAGFSTAGARGCFLSHLAMLEKGMEVQGKHTLIMEDDLTFSADFERHWQICMEELAREDWDILYAGHYQSNLPEGLNLLPPDVAILCAHFVLFNQRVLPTIVGGLRAMLERPEGDPLGGPMHVDGAYSFLRARNPALRAFAYTPALGRQRPSRSDIAPNNLLDQVALLRPAMGLYRRIKDRLKYR